MAVPKAGHCPPVHHQPRRQAHEQHAMFSGASSFAERLRAAAQAGVEQFDQARVHAPDLHLPKINLTGPISATSTAQGTSSPVQSPLSPGAESVKRLVGISSPRRSGELERTASTGSGHSALSSRLNSLVAGAAKGRNQVKSAAAGASSTPTAGSPSQTATPEGNGNTVPRPQPAGVTGEAIGTSVRMHPSLISFLLPLVNRISRSRQYTASAVSRSRSLRADRNKYTRLEPRRYWTSYADSSIRIITIQYTSEPIAVIAFRCIGNPPSQDTVTSAKSRCGADHSCGRRRTGKGYSFGRSG